MRPDSYRMNSGMRVSLREIDKNPAQITGRGDWEGMMTRLYEIAMYSIRDIFESDDSAEVRIENLSGLKAEIDLLIEAISTAPEKD